MQQLLTALVGSLLFGVLVAVAWLVFWTFVVPQTIGGQVWDGHTALIAPVFLVASLFAIGQWVLSQFR